MAWHHINVVIQAHDGTQDPGRAGKYIEEAGC
jgi:hypothetical protein